MKYHNHSDDSVEIEIRLIENGFIVKYRHLLTLVERFFDTTEELNRFLIQYYNEEK